MTVLVIMGVAGSGKTTIGQMVADRLGYALVEGDAFHPPENVAKMAGGTPLDDADRWPWLQTITREIDAALAAGEDLVVACSALKRRYRDLLAAGRPGVRLVHLHAEFALLAARLAAREDHFMPARLLQSQFAALEPPMPDEKPIAVHVGRPASECAAQIIAALGPPEV